MFKRFAVMLDLAEIFRWQTENTQSLKRTKKL